MATIRARGVAALLALAMLAGACSNDDDPTLDDLVPPTSESTTSSSSTTTATTEPTTTTLPERDQAKAEIQEVVETWFFYPRDTSKGDEGIGAQYLTGLMLYRHQEITETVTADGHIEIGTGNGSLEISDIELDLRDGFADVDYCFGPSWALLDAETRDVIEADNPKARIRGTFQMKLAEDGWKINDSYTYPDGEGGLQRCETDS